MKRFIEGEERSQVTLLPECLDDYVGEDNPVRVVDAFVDELPLQQLGFDGVEPAATGRPSYHPAELLKIYIYGYLNRVQSSRRLEREAQRNVELMWLTGRLAPDFKTITDFRKDHGDAIRWGTQPIFGAIDSTAAYSDGYPCTMRTARSRTSGENLLDLFMAPSSQELEPPRIPGRFRPGGVFDLCPGCAQRFSGAASKGPLGHVPAIPSQSSIPAPCSGLAHQHS